MMAIEFNFINHGSEDSGEIKIGSKRLAPGLSLHEFPGVLNLTPGQSLNTTLGIDFR